MGNGKHGWLGSPPTENELKGRLYQCVHHIDTNRVLDIAGNDRICRYEAMSISSIGLNVQSSGNSIHKRRGATVWLDTVWFK
jgi:hypothetical protein